jgi:hypothetical protein
MPFERNISRPKIRFLPIVEMTLKTPENFLASNKFNELHGYAPPKINDLQTFLEFSEMTILSRSARYCVSSVALYIQPIRGN